MNGPEADTANTPARGKSLAYYPMLDSVRALAALGVVMLHVTARTGSLQHGLLHPVGKVLSHGDVGVPVFFVLSGLLLYRPYASAHRDGSRLPPLVRFYRRRFLRIVPAYWVVLAFVMFAFDTVSHGDAWTITRHALLLDSYSSAWASGSRGTWMFQTWSLATEVAFYLMLPAIAAAAGALMRRRTRLSTELAVLGALAAAGFTVSAGLSARRPGGTVASTWLPAQLQYFALGMALAALTVWPDAKPARAVSRFASQHAGICWALAAAALLTSALALGLPEQFGVHVGGRRTLARDLCYAVTAVGVVLPGAFGTTVPGRLRRALAHPAARALGLVSYGVFLWHLDWLTLEQKWGAFRWSPRLRFPVALALTLTLAVVSSVLLYVLVERPLQRPRPPRLRALFDAEARA